MARITQVRIENITPVRLVDLVLSGRIRLPSFQRDYRWQSNDVENLFDSIRKSYPIGSLLLWERPAPAERITIGPLVLDVPETARALWVVDGQQRITTLVGGLTAGENVSDPRFNVFAHLPSLTFRAAARTPTGPWLPLRSTATNQGLLRWERSHSELLGEEEYAAADELATALRDYPIPSYIVEADDEREVRVVFDRMNNYGRSLTKDEVFNALHGVQDNASPGDLRGVGDAVAAAGFGRLRDGELLRSLLALRGPDIFRDVHDEFSDDEERRAAFELTEHVLLDVVAVLRDELRIPHVRVLPYPAIMPILAAWVHRFGRPEGRATTLLRRWVWRGAALGANPGGDVPLARNTLRAITAAKTAQQAALALVQTVPPSTDRWRPDLTQISANRAATRVNMLGLIDLGPTVLIPAGSGLPLPNPVLAPSDLFDTVRQPLQRIISGTRLGIGTAAISTSELANRILHPPVRGGVLRALLRADAATLAGHGIDEECRAALADGRWDEFLSLRSTLIENSIAELVDRRAEWGARDRFSTAELLGTEAASA